jgi:uncharacterized phage protein (TIGR02216 family)
MAEFGDFAATAARVATGLLGWSPDAFWHATVAELRLALEGRLGPPPGCGSRTDLERLMREFPDG